MFLVGQTYIILVYSTNQILYKGVEKIKKKVKEKEYKIKIEKEQQAAIQSYYSPLASQLKCSIK